MENEFMDQFMENRQNYMMENNSIQQLNVASAGDGVVGGVQAEVVSGVAGDILGVKYDEHHEEHDVGDDDELKYVEEVQQSEKQQQQLQSLKNIGLDDDGIYESNELAEKEISHNAALGFGNENGGFVFGGDHHHHEKQQKHDLFGIGNGHETNGHDVVNTDEDFGTLVSTGFEEKLSMMESELDAFKAEDDLLTVSNVTEAAGVFIPQVDVKIETKLEHNEMLDEEEPSSLATNTTNGTSSLSENILPHAHIDTQAQVVGNLEDKENSDPLLSERPQDLDLEQGQSQLNPDAKEFVPSFGSNPGSPTSPFAAVAPLNEPVLSEIMETQMYFGQAPAVVPRHLMGDDDFVAQSPCKGKDDNNMDTVLIPRELSEFEQEADKRPHELEPEDNEGFSNREEVMTPDQAIQQLPHDDVEIQENEIHADSPDFQPASFMDHGPETCVDPETDLDMQPSTELSSIQGNDDVMKRSIYVANDDAIEDVLNSVQPIPTEIDSVNNSFIEESATESAANQIGDKELLQVEEKEHVSHSPSTEEIQMNLQNNLNSSNKDIPQLPIDMHESLFLKQEQNLLADHEQNDNVSATNPFELEEILHDQQQPAKSEELENQLLLQEQLHKEPENRMSLEENLNEVNHTETEDLMGKPGFEQENRDQLPLQDPAEKLYLCEETEENISADTEQYQSKADNFLENRQEINESYSPLKINDEVSTTHTFESLINETPENLLQQEISNSHHFETFNNDSVPGNLQQPDLNDVDMTPSFIADEKHLLEETKEQQMFSVSGLEQQMSEMALNKSDGDLSQAEENAVNSLTAIEDVSENLINPDQATDQVVVDQSHTEQEEHLNLVDDSFNRHEQECQLQYEQEQKAKQQAVKTETEFDLVHESLEATNTQQQQDEMEPAEIRLEQQHEEKQKSFENLLVQQQHDETEALETPKKQQVQEKLESLEAPIVEQQQEEFEIEKAAVEEPIIDAKQASTLLSYEETENITEERHESPLCMLPEVAPNEVVEPTMAAHSEAETEIETKQEEQPEIAAEVIKEPHAEESKEATAEAVKQDLNVEPEHSEHVPVEAAVVAAAAAVTTAALAAKAASSPTTKKPLTKTTTTTAKPKVTSTTAAKKPAEAAKKPVASASKPRVAPSKPAAAADKKPATTTTTANKKPTATSKVVAKTSTTSTTARTLSAAPKTTTTSKPTTTPRTAPASSLTTRKPTSANGPLAKPRPTSAPTKPTTLGLSATNGAPKTKPLSPRSTLTSQVRKIAPATTAAKSPNKTTTTNGLPKTASSTLTSRTKTTATTASSTAGTASKPFTARPAPKFNSSSSATTTTTTTRRTTTAVSATSSTTTSTLKASSTPLRKSSPAKPMASKTPTKPATGASKSKTPVSKTASDSPAAKPAPIRRPVDKTIAAPAAAATNGDANSNNKQLNGLSEDQLNGDMKAVQQEQQQQQNGDSSIPMQTEKLEQPFLETRDEQIPMDLINA